ncbi:MAG TPA: multidrug transporter [Clostridiaceae bacterium]|jgi:hypothetical protein|nr:multidrug transporter [Clostridiaceae bacterium]
MKKQNERKHWQHEDGLGTLEVVIIIAVLLAVAMIFRTQLLAFANSLIAQVFDFSILDGL